MAQYKYIVTVGNHPHYKKMVRSNSLEVAEKRQNKLAKQFTDDQVDLYELVNGEWEHKSFVSVLSFG